MEIGWRNKSNSVGCIGTNAGLRSSIHRFAPFALLLILQVIRNHEYILVLVANFNADGCVLGKKKGTGHAPFYACRSSFSFFLTAAVLGL
jgi:hypothetical protein